MAATAKHGVQRALGLKRTIWQKILPFVSIAIAFVPAIVFVGMAAFIPDQVESEDLLPSYADYYGFVTAAIVIFTAFVAPEVLCTDRRTGMLGLYLASPLDRNTYLLAKAAAVGFVLSIVTIGPLLLLLVAYTVVGNGPANLGDWLTTFARILVGGIAVTALHTSLSLAVSSFTSRRAAASATIVVMLFASSAVVGALVGDDGGAGGSYDLLAFDLFSLPFHLVYHLWGQGAEWNPDGEEVSAALIAVANIAWTTLFAVLTWWRYRKLAVTR